MDISHHRLGISHRMGIALLLLALACGQSAAQLGGQSSVQLGGQSSVQLSTQSPLCSDEAVTQYIEEVLNVDVLYITRTRHSRCRAKVAGMERYLTCVSFLSVRY